jgi:hypothetical protein
MYNWPLKFHFIAVLLVFLSGCDCIHPSTNQNDLDQFKMTYPQDAAKYSYLQEVKIDVYVANVVFCVGRVETALRVIEKKYPSAEGLSEALRRATKESSERYEQVKANAEELKVAAKGGTLCEFEYENQGRHEWGFLVLKGGKITRREVWPVKPWSVPLPKMKE